MSEDTMYNGWKNYPTWCVNLWLSNEEPLYREAGERARQMREDAKEDPHTFDAPDRGQTRLWTVAEAARYKLADNFKEWVCDELAPDLGATFAADLLGYALGEVDWDEIANVWLEDL
jgi:hypothetical protein